MADETNAGGDTGAMTAAEAVEALLAPPKRDKRELEPADEADAATPETDDAEEADDSPDEGQVEAADADEDEEADDEGDDSEAEAPQYVAEDAKVKLPDGSETTVAELMKGSMRQADYTRKTQEVSADRKRVREMEEQLNGYSQSILERLHVAERLAERAKPVPPPADLYDTDPVAYLQYKDMYREAVAEWERDYTSTLDGIRQTLGVREQADKSRTEEQIAESRQKLAEAIPDLRDNGKRDAIVRDIAEVAQKAGFSPEEIGSWSDHRLAVLAHMAVRGHKLEEAKPKAEKKVAAASPVQKPGQRSTKKQTRQAEFLTAKRRLAQTKSKDDAVAALLSGGFV